MYVVVIYDSMSEVVDKKNNYGKEFHFSSILDAMKFSYVCIEQKKYVLILDCSGETK